jgi:hypothetical protein
MKSCALLFFFLAILSSVFAQSDKATCLKQCQTYQNAILKDQCKTSFKAQSASKIFCNGLTGKAKSTCVRALGESGCGSGPSCPQYASCEGNQCRKAC